MVSSNCRYSSARVGKRGRGEVLVEPSPLGKSVLVMNKDCSQSTLRAHTSSSLKLKEDLTSTPVLLHFDPSLRTAVHINGSQNAVGAVLLQRQQNEDNPRPVAFMSRKLSGAQYRYDARNVEHSQHKWH